MFALARLLGGSVALAWGLQLTLSGMVALALCALWCSRIRFELQAAALATGALLVTPYLFVYDLVVLAVPMAFLVRVGFSGGFLRGEMIGMGIASFLVLIFPLVTAPVGLASVVLVGLLVVRRVWREWQSLSSDGPQTAEISLPARP